MRATTALTILLAVFISTVSYAQCNNKNRNNGFCSHQDNDGFYAGKPLDLNWQQTKNIDRVQLYVRQYNLSSFDSLSSFELTESGKWKKTPNSISLDSIPCETGKIDLDLELQKNKWWTFKKGDYKTKATYSITLHENNTKRPWAFQKVFLSERDLQTITAKHSYPEFADKIEWWHSTKDSLLGTGETFQVDFSVGAMKPGVYHYRLRYNFENEVCPEKEAEFVLFTLILLPEQAEALFLEESPNLNPGVASSVTSCRLEGENFWRVQTPNGPEVQAIQHFLDSEMLYPAGCSFSYNSFDRKEYSPWGTANLMDNEIRFCAFGSETTELGAKLFFEASMVNFHPDFTASPQTFEYLVNFTTVAKRGNVRESGDTIVSTNLANSIPGLTAEDTLNCDLSQLIAVIPGSDILIGPKKVYGDDSNTSFQWTNAPGLQSTSGQRVLVKTGDIIWLDHGGNSATFEALITDHNTGLQRSWCTKLVKGEIHQIKEEPQERKMLEKELVLFPNPGNDLLNLQGLAKEDFIQVFNMNGVLLWSAVANADQIELNTNSWAPGLYIVQVRSLDGTLSKRKWLKAD